MPIVNIWMHEGKSPAYKKQVSEGIHDAMMDVLGVPSDTWDHLFYNMTPGDMVYDANFSGVVRSQDMIFVQFFINSRPPEMKKRFFEAVAEKITTRCALSRQDLLMSITEVASENWWAFGRRVNPDTGFDIRMDP